MFYFFPSHHHRPITNPLVDPVPAQYPGIVIAVNSPGNEATIHGGRLFSGHRPLVLVTVAGWRCDRHLVAGLSADGPPSFLRPPPYLPISRCGSCRCCCCSCFPARCYLLCCESIVDLGPGLRPGSRVLDARFDTIRSKAVYGLTRALWPPETLALRDRSVSHLYVSDSRDERYFPRSRGVLFERSFLDPDSRFEAVLVAEFSTVYRILWDAR